MKTNELLWSCMLQLGMHMWNNQVGTTLKFDRKVWAEVTDKLAECGCNAIVLDIGEGLVFDSHPEIAIPGAYTKDEMKAEIERLKGMGFEIIPKLNFSTAHDQWLGEYMKILSTPEYYTLCRELIEEVCELFKPRFFHIGMDEETYEIEKSYPYIRLRQNDLWWHDLYFYVECVEACGARPMMWSDYARHRPEEFVEKCPKSMVQCVWYYFTEFDMNVEKHRIRILPYEQCEAAGFDQVPAGSNVYHRENMELLTRYVYDKISEEHMFGMMNAPWFSTEEKNKAKLFEAAETIRESRAAFEALRNAK